MLQSIFPSAIWLILSFLFSLLRLTRWRALLFHAGPMQVPFSVRDRLRAAIRTATQHVSILAINFDGYRLKHCRASPLRRQGGAKPGRRDH